MTPAENRSELEEKKVPHKQPNYNGNASLEVDFESLLNQLKVWYKCHKVTRAPIGGYFCYYHPRWVALQDLGEDCVLTSSCVWAIHDHPMVSLPKGITFKGIVRLLHCFTDTFG